MSFDLDKSFLMHMPAPWASYTIIKDQKKSTSQFTFNDVNAQYEIISGLSRERLIGKSIEEIYADPDESQWMADLAKSLHPGKTAVSRYFSKSHHRWYQVYVYMATQELMIVMYNDVSASEIKIIKAELVDRKEKTFLHYISALSIDPMQTYSDFCENITHACTHLLEVSGASIWLQEEATNNWLCYGSYDLVSKEKCVGLKLPENNRSELVALLSDSGYIALEDVRMDSHIQKSLDKYMEYKPVGSIMMAAIVSQGSVSGIICAEFTAAGRIWEPYEINFLCHIADKASHFYTEKKQYELKQQLQQLSHVIPGAMFQLETNAMGTYSIVHISDGAKELFEKDMDALNSPYRLFDNVCSGQIASLYKSLKTSFDEVIPWNYEFCIVPGSGNKKWIQVHSVPRKTPEGRTLWDGVMLDITSRKNHEEAFNQTSEKLKIAEKSTEFKKNFFANMSHEMRTPLTGIIGTTELLLNTRLDVQQKDFVNTIRISGENLRETINEILDYSKIEAGMARINPVVFASNTLFNHASKLFASVCQKNIELQTWIDEQLPPYVSADLNRINQILTNLVFNAVKFTPKGKIMLSAQIDKFLEGKQILIKIKVTDTGIGIRPEAQKVIFEPFYQERFMDASDTQQFEGTGLGLPICRELSELLQGEIGVISEPGHGSTFWFTFIAHKSEKPIEDEQLINVIPELIPEKLNILLVEDKAVNQKVIKLLLGSLGHTVTLATHGQEAINIYEPERYDLILMDIKMPVMDGITATQKLKEKYQTLPPIVGLSANAFEGDREKYMALGMDEYLTKPFKTNDFVEMATKVLGKKA
jgi:PAS domain S-box-containing protein